MDKNIYSRLSIQSEYNGRCFLHLRHPVSGINLFGVEDGNPVGYVCDGKSDVFAG